MAEVLNLASCAPLQRAAARGRLTAPLDFCQITVTKLSGHPCDGISDFKRFIAESRESSLRDRLISALVSKIGVSRMNKYTLGFDQLPLGVRRSNLAGEVEMRHYCLRLLVRPPEK